MKIFSRTRIVQTDVFFQMFLVSLPENLSTGISQLQRITIAISVKIDDSQKYLQMFNLKTLILKSTYQHVKKQFKLQPQDLSQRQENQNTKGKKYTFWSFKDIFSSILNWSTEHFSHLKNDSVTQKIQFFSEYLNPGLYFLQNYCISIYIQSGLQFLINYGVRFFPRSAKLGSGFLRLCVWVWVRFVNDACIPALCKISDTHFASVLHDTGLCGGAQLIKTWSFHHALMLLFYQDIT